MAKLISDVQSFGEVKFITESIDPDGSKTGSKKPPMFYLDGCMAVADRVNGNNRSYPYKLLKEEIERLDKEFIQTGRCLGSLEHPDYPEIRPEDACVKIIEIHEDNKSWVGRGCILASQPEYGVRGTPKGDLLLSLVQYGTPVGYSTRALGELNEDESEVVELKLMDIDAVLNPSIAIFSKSNGNRFVNGILESKQFVCDFHPLQERAFENFEKRVSRMPNTAISRKKAEFLGAAVHEFLESLVR